MLAVFDWDGTLCDSLGHIVASLQAAARQMGLAMPEPAAARSVIGLGLSEALAALHPELSARQIEDLRDLYRQHHGHPRRPADRLYPGARECLSELRAAGVVLAVATGKSRAGLERALRETCLTDWFGATRTAEESASKPDPTMLHQLMFELGMGPEQTVLIGDTTFDLNMASAAGIVCAGVTFGAHPRSQLERCGPDALFEQLCQVTPWVLHRLGSVAR